VCKQHTFRNEHSQERIGRHQAPKRQPKNCTAAGKIMIVGIVPQKMQDGGGGGAFLPTCIPFSLFHTHTTHTHTHAHTHALAHIVESRIWPGARTAHPLIPKSCRNPGASQRCMWRWRSQILTACLVWPLASHLGSGVVKHDRGLSVGNRHTRNRDEYIPGSWLGNRNFRCSRCAHPKFQKRKKKSSAWRAEMARVETGSLAYRVQFPSRYRA